MAPLGRGQTRLASFFAILTILATQARALHFYIENRQPKCFFEELPKDTLVVGM
jgi:p24 family protein alpha